MNNLLFDWMIIAGQVLQLHQKRYICGAGKSYYYGCLTEWKGVTLKKLRQKETGYRVIRQKPGGFLSQECGNPHFVSMT